MSRGEAYGESGCSMPGKAIDRAFLELTRNLGPAPATLHAVLRPRTHQRGLKPREDSAPLKPGKWYTLVIDRAWPDAEGNRLKESYRKSFRVGPPDENQPDPKTWKMRPPAAGTRAALVDDLPKPLDHALLHRICGSPMNPGRRCPATRPSRRGNVLALHADGPGKAGKYHLVADTRAGRSGWKQHRPTVRG